MTLAAILTKPLLTSPGTDVAGLEPGDAFEVTPDESGNFVYWDECGPLYLPGDALVIVE